MNTVVAPDRRAARSLRWAQLTCLLFGLTLLMCGLAPFVVQRIVSKHPAPMATLTAGSPALGLGIGFIVLGTLVGRGVRWALWAALVASLSLLFGSLLLPWLAGQHAPALYPLLLSTGTAVASALALEANRPGRQT